MIKPKKEWERIMRYKSKQEKLKPHYPVLVFRIATLLACLTLISTYLLSGAY